MRNRFLLALIMLVVGFLAGFLLEYSGAREARQQAAATGTQLQACQSSMQLSDIRDKAALMYLEATKKNYGTAGQYASQLFDQVQKAANATQNDSIRNTLHGMLSNRDKITADLAQGNAAVVDELQPVLASAEQNLR
jgi:hypothetical protein